MAFLTLQCTKVTWTIAFSHFLNHLCCSHTSPPLYIIFHGFPHPLHDPSHSPACPFYPPFFFLAFCYQHLSPLLYIIFILFPSPPPPASSIPSPCPAYPYSPSPPPIFAFLTHLWTLFLCYVYSIPYIKCTYH